MLVNRGGCSKLRQYIAEKSTRCQFLKNLKNAKTAPPHVKNQVAGYTLNSDYIDMSLRLQKRITDLPNRFMRNLLFSPQAKYELDFMIKQPDSIKNYPHHLRRFVEERITYNPLKWIANGFNNLMAKIKG